MKVIIAKTIGFCPGVKAAVKAAFSAKVDNTCILGEIIHNQFVIENLKNKGIKTVNCQTEVDTENVIIRSHGVPDETYEYFKSRGISVKDCTCPFVARIHGIVREYEKKDYHIVIVGYEQHAEIIGINGACHNNATVIGSTKQAHDFVAKCGNVETFVSKKLAIVCQTTFSCNIFKEIVEIIRTVGCQTVEVFDTICYTTMERQKEVADLATICDKMLILGSRNSSNTNQLFKIAKSACEQSFFVESVKDLASLAFCCDETIGVASGASTHTELILEVCQYMSEKEIQSREAVEDFGTILAKHESGAIVPRIGANVEVKVIFADEKGITVSLGGKNDGFVSKEHACFEGEYNPSDFVANQDIGVTIIGGKDKETGLIPVSKKKFDAMKKGNEIVNTIRNKEEFSLLITEIVKGGVAGYLGNYRVFVPQSQVDEHFIKNLDKFKGKKLRLRATEIDDKKFKIIASQKVILVEERTAREDEFFSNIEPDLVIIGKVMRITKFGAFVDVGGFDCLAHIVDLSWTKINSVDDVLKVGQEYEFVVLKVDRATKKVSLGYKQLHLHPFLEFVSTHNIGDIIEGKVVRIKEFGAFVKIAEGVDGLVHISEASHDFLKNISEAVKVGDQIKAMITNIDDDKRKISLSIKAATEPPQVGAIDESSDESGKGKKGKKGKNAATSAENNYKDENVANNPFASLLKDIETGE